MDNEKPDAGLRSLNHYQQKLPPWRYRPRQKLLPLVRWETPYLAWFQETVRTPALDSYFAITANLGTHTFFMVVLPILFWCGYTNTGRGMVHILASGVFFSGFVKDLLCLPRPLSPPLHRITMSGSAALEYGFPSTHSTNAVSVAVYALYMLNDPESTMSPMVNTFLQALSYSYAASIIIGRLYCGMHGFLDVIIGSTLGALISFVQCGYGDAFDEYLYAGGLWRILGIVAIILILVRIHPEPADDCPCFDDSVAFAGVMIGVEFGNWHFAQSGLAWDSEYPATVPFGLEQLGWVKTILRIVVGVLTIFAWREVMKPALLRLLPPLFRVLEGKGLDLPRKFFIQASTYKNVPSNITDNVIPSVSEIPSMLTSIRHPRRRAISVGPQSEADAYETLAYREKRRRESVNNSGGATTSGMWKSDHTPNTPRLEGNQSTSPSRVAAKLEGYEQQMGMGSASSPSLPAVDTNASSNSSGSLAPPPIITVGADDEFPLLEEPDEKEMFSKLEKPRVRYDVEVVTKLIVYSGIAWLAVEGNPLLFELIGLGMGEAIA